MNVVNKVIATIVLILVVIAMPVLIFFSLTMRDKAVIAVSEAVASLQPRLTSIHQAVFVVVPLLILLAAVLLLWLEVRRTPARAIQVHKVAGGEARVTVESIVQRLEHDVSRLQDVTAVKPLVVSKGSGVDVLLSIQTAPEIDVPMKTEEVVQVVKEVVENQMGVKLQRVSVEIKHAPYSENAI